MQNVKPVNIQIAVSAYLFPLLDAGWNSLMRSIAMNSMGCGGAEKCSSHTNVCRGCYFAQFFIVRYRCEIIIQVVACG